MVNCLLCLAVPVALLAAAFGGVQVLLQNPKYAKDAIHYIVDAGGMDKSVFDHIKVLDETAWTDIITKMNLGLAESYMHGKIELDLLPFFFKLLNGTSIGTRRKDGSQIVDMIDKAVHLPATAMSLFTNQQNRDRSTRVTKQHYDAGNDLYEVMLGPSMSYTCAYWKDAKNLDEAQQNKFNLVFRKLESTPGMKVVDLGMGWGTAAAYMHEHGKIDVTGVSLSEQQVKWATNNLAKPGLKFIWQDYRDHCNNPEYMGTYDRVYSIGMLEHVGFNNHASFFKCVKNLLKPDGLAVIHSIGEPDFLASQDAFLDKYIFPGMVVPAMSSLMPAIEDNFILEDFQNFGHDYARTLEAWDQNSKQFFANNPTAYTPEFQRMWEYYLKLCEALFELRINQLWQVVLSPRPATRKRIDRQL